MDIAIKISDLEHQLSDAQSRADEGWKAYRDRTEQEQAMERNAKHAWNEVMRLERAMRAAIEACQKAHRGPMAGDYCGACRMLADAVSLC